MRFDSIGRRWRPQAERPAFAAAPRTGVAAGVAAALGTRGGAAVIAVVVAAVIAVLGLAAGCAATGDGSTVDPGPTGAADRVDVIVYRTADDSDPRPVNLYVDQAYVASLMPGGYTRFRHCAGRAELVAAFDDARRHHHGRLDRNEPVTLMPGHDHYWRVAAAPSSPSSPTASTRSDRSIGAATPGLRGLIESDAASFDRDGRHRQRQTISRLAPRDCAASRGAAEPALMRLPAPAPSRAASPPGERLPSRLSLR